MNEENLFIYEEDGFCELIYTHGDLIKFESKSKKYDKLQSNWNSLREWLEENQRDDNPNNDEYYGADILDKMNELEGKSNDN